MKAIILAAGRGSRLCNLTQDKPKCMVELKNKPLLHWQIEALNGAGINDIYIVSGYLKDKIVANNIKLLENTRWYETNMVMSLLIAKVLLFEDTCIISYADIVYPTETIQILAQHKDDDLVITYNTQWFDLWKERFENPLSDAESFKIDNNGYLLEIGKKTNSLDDIQGQYMGLLKFTPKGSQIIIDYVNSLPKEKQDRLDMTSLLNQLIENNIKIKAIPIQGKWYEIDNENDLILANNKSTLF